MFQEAMHIREYLPRVLSLGCCVLAVAFMGKPACPSSAQESSKGPIANSQIGLVQWSFKPLKNPPLPKVWNAKWVQSPIDAFILSALERRGITPSAPTDRRRLIRRVTFDLIGLPPTPQ